MVVALPGGGGGGSGNVTGPASSVDSDIALFNGTTGKIIKDSGQTIAQILAPYVPSTRSISTTAPLTGGGDLSANRTFAIPAATTSVNGYLTSTDWNTFNGKVSPSRTINTTSPLTGGGDLSADRTFAMPAATTSVNGYLTSADWNTFNGKVSGPSSATDNAIARFDGTTGKLIQNSIATLDDDGLLSTQQVNAAYFDSDPGRLFGQMFIGTVNAAEIQMGSDAIEIFVHATQFTFDCDDILFRPKVITLNQDSGVGSGSDAGIQIQEGNFIQAYFRTTNDRTGWVLKSPLSSSQFIFIPPDDFTGTIKTVVLTDDRTWSFPDASGTLSLAESSTLQAAYNADSEAPIQITYDNKNNFIFQADGGAVTFTLGGSSASIDASVSIALSIASASYIGLGSDLIMLGKTVSLSDTVGMSFSTSTGSVIGLSTSQKFAFWGATPIIQPVNTVAIDSVLVNTGLRAASGLANFATTLKPRTGSATAGTAPVVFTSGTILTTPVAGTLEYNGELFFSPSTTRFQFAFIDRAQTWTATQTLNNVTFTDATNITFNATTGSKIGTATSQKLAFWNATPIIQPVNTVAINDVLVNTGLRATGGTSNFSTTIVTRAGTTTAGTAPFVFTSGTNLTTPVAGTMEYNGELFFSPSTTRFQFAFIDRAQTWTATQTLNNVTFTDATNITFNTSIGSKIGNATNQKFAFWNATPIVQPANTVAIDDVLVNTGLRASGGLGNFATTLKPRTGSATAGTAPVVFTSGTVLTTPVAGTMEYNGELFFSPSTTRFQVAFIDRAQTFSAAQTFTSDITISKATPALILTDSGGDDYKIDVASGNFGITNTTDGVRGLQVSATNEWLFTNLTFGGPDTSQLLSVQDRVSNAASGSRAAFSASANVVTSASWSGGNIRGFLGGAVYVADQDFNNGAALIGLEGGVTIISNTHIVQSAIGLFGTLQLSGSSTTTAGTAFGSFITVGSGHTLSTLKHYAISNASFSGTVTTQYGIFMSALTGAASNFEVWMDAAARTYYRSANQYAYSSAADTFDLSANTTLNLRIAGTIKTALTATALSQTGDFKLTTAGNGIYIKEGSNATMGRAVMVGGTVVVSTTKVTTTSEIFLSSNVDGGTPTGAVRISARTAATSFTITSTNVLDTSTVAWVILEPA